MREVCIVGYARTPIGKFLGSLKGLDAPEMGAIAIREAAKRANVPLEDIDEVIMANIHQAGVRPNPARQAAVKAGVPFSVPSWTVNKLCGSGVKALEVAWQSVALSQSDIIVVVGSESMSRVPYLVMNMREGARMGSQVLEDSLFYDGFICPFTLQHMGITAENVAERFGVTRDDQDEFALRSQVLAVQAQVRGVFAQEIVPVEMTGRKDQTKIVTEDECPRRDTSAEKLRMLKPAFKPGGTVTAGNSCGLADGAAALVVASEDAARKRGLEILARIRGFASVGIDPAIMGFAPALAIRRLLQKTGHNVQDIEILELNEAFAAQAVAVIRDLGIPLERVNPNGGAIALGHPVGASGARLVLTLIRELRARGLRRGVAALCMGGGQGIATMLEV